MFEAMRAEDDDSVRRVCQVARSVPMEVCIIQGSDRAGLCALLRANLHAQGRVKMHQPDSFLVFGPLADWLSSVSASAKSFSYTNAT